MAVSTQPQPASKHIWAPVPAGATLGSRFCKSAAGARGQDCCAWWRPMGQGILRQASAGAARGACSTSFATQWCILGCRVWCAAAAGPGRPPTGAPSVHLSVHAHAEAHPVFCLPWGKPGWPEGDPWLYGRKCLPAWLKAAIEDHVLLGSEGCTFQLSPGLHISKYVKIFCKAEMPAAARCIVSAYSLVLFDCVRWCDRQT